MKTNSSKARSVPQLPRAVAVVGMIALASSVLTLASAAPVKPFPQSATLQYQGISPQLDRSTLNSDAKNYYDVWKSTFVKRARYNTAHYKIMCPTWQHPDRCISEEMGYGMITVVTMAGYDSEAQSIFDGLNEFRKHYPAFGSDYLMQWEVVDEVKDTGGVATDGDMDMAIALLMAYQQWGVQKYYDDARNIIREFEDKFIRGDGSLRFGNYESADGIGTRTSDLMLAYFPIYKQATGNPVWDKVAQFAYQRLEDVQKNDSPNTGLIPEYVVKGTNGTWGAAKTKFHDADDAYAFSWNAVRDPWRIGYSYLCNNDTRARNIVTKMMTWLSGVTMDNADNIKSIYRMDGFVLGDYSSLIFTSVMGTGAMSGGKQALLDSVYNKVRTWHDTNYYSESVTMMQMLVMSRNLWLPDGLPTTYFEPASGTNLLSNPGFEKPERWMLGTHQSRVANDKNSGTNSLRINGTKDFCSTTQNIYVNPNTLYALTAYVKGSATISLSARQPGSWAVINDVNVTPNGNWKQYTNIFNSGSNLQIMIVLFDAGVGTTYVDDVKVVKLGSDQDSDGDGFDDDVELKYGSDLQNAASLPEYAKATLSTKSSIALEFVTNLGRKYQIQSCDDLTNWTALGQIFNGIGGKTNLSVSPTGASRKFWRIKRTN